MIDTIHMQNLNIMLFCENALLFSTNALLFSLLFFDFDFTSGVGESHVEFGGSLDDLNSLSGRDVVSNFTSVGTIVGKKNFEVFKIGN